MRNRKNKARELGDSFFVYNNIVVLWGTVDAVQAKNLALALIHLDFCIMEEVKNGGEPQDIIMLICSPGGAVNYGMAIHDVMRVMSCDVQTIAMGMAASMGAFLLASGTPGKRFAMPNCEIMIHQPLGGAQGQATDIEIEANQIIRIRKQINRLLASYTGRSEDEIERATERNNYMTAEQAKAFGLVDDVLHSIPREVGSALKEIRYYDEE